MPELVIAGAGRIGRGFLAQLFHRAGWSIACIDDDAGLVQRLNAAGGWRVEIAGRPEAGERIPLRAAVVLGDAAGVAALIAGADVLVGAVGARNLAALAQALAPALAARTRPLDWLICENADAPARVLAQALDASGVMPADWRNRLGLVETQVLRSGMDPDPALAARDPLGLRMQDWWTLPCDRAAFRAAIPAVPGLEPKGNFAHELQRKVYTFNGLNGPLAYLGALRGQTCIHEPANDPVLHDLLTAIRTEVDHGLIAEFGLDVEDQRRFGALAWAKYRDPALADPIARHARDSARKLAPRERLIGPASLCLAHDRAPRACARAIAAALVYAGDDPGSRQVADLRARCGGAAVLREICGLDPDHGLGALVVAALALLAEDPAGFLVPSTSTPDRPLPHGATP